MNIFQFFLTKNPYFCWKSSEIRNLKSIWKHYKNTVLEKTNTEQRQIFITKKIVSYISHTSLFQGLILS